MRLAKIKLAGFKTFVDPTTVVLPGNLVGIVGPNGCGKSNIIDAVRWVLGESRASALRGESMHDVIFNGSSTRKPVARASVEMVFDNTEGRIKGLWGAYGEIAVKRVLERSGDSSYLINQKPVRRKDVIDLFLGTGLGPRAYAIIEQGMIGRIIEARPQDMRAFLEEAAGITKYRERRRETLMRLSDAQENLVRLEDICAELAQRVEQLDAQAQQARRYQTLLAEHDRQQRLLWLLKREEAAAAHAQSLEAIEKTSQALAADEALLDAHEAKRTALEDAQTQRTAAMDEAQAHFHAAHAHLARLEQARTHRATEQARLRKRLDTLLMDRTEWLERLNALNEQTQVWEAKAAHAALALEAAHALCDALDERLPGFQDAREDAKRALADKERSRHNRLQQQRLEEQHAHSADEALKRLALRHSARCAEYDEWAAKAPDPAVHAALQEKQKTVEAEKAALTKALSAVEAQKTHAQHALTLAQAAFEHAQHEESRLRARHEALDALQARFALAPESPSWQDSLPMLVTLLRVRKGWEPAFEAVLRERLTARMLTHLDTLKTQCPSRGSHTLALILMDTPPAPFPEAHSAPITPWPCAPPTPLPLLSLIEAVDEPILSPLLAQWLGGVYAVEDLSSWFDRHATLPPGLCLVTPSGQRLSAHTFLQGMPDEPHLGFLARQTELNELDTQLRAATAHTQGQATERAQARQYEDAILAQEAGLRAQHQTQAQALHEITMALLQSEQAQARVHERLAHLKRDQDELEKEIENETRRQDTAYARAEAHAQALEAEEEALAHAQRTLEIHEAQARDLESQRAQADRALQEARFAEREAANGQEETARQRAWAEQAHARITDDIRACETALETEQNEEARDDIVLAREKTQAAQEALDQARQSRDGLQETLKTLGQTIQTVQARLTTWREARAQAQLTQQAAALTHTQFQARLDEVSADEAALRPLLQTAPKETVLIKEVARLAKEIAALGAVNLGALNDLETAQTRKAHLDGHVADLLGAIATLEGAISRMDRETRERLEHTYNAVNGHFARLFPRLFGGGQAQLILTGEDILDAGLQIVAQPPGKKNSSIHLLSGGEKALTAIALVFSFFELNPAPFCMLDEVDAPLDDANTERYCSLVRHMSAQTQFLFISHSKITMEIARYLIGVTMQEQGVSRVVDVDIDEALRLADTGVT